MKIYQEMRNPLGIVLHHSDTEQGNVESFRRTHVNEFHWCFSEDTEVLTNTGWKNCENISNEDLVYTIDKGFSSDWEKIQFENCETVELKTLNYSGCFTLNHRLYSKKQSTKQYSTELVSEVLDRVTPTQILCSIIDNKNYKVNYSKDFYELASAIVADGSVFYTPSGKFKGFQFRLKKLRKRDYFIDLLDRNKIIYSVSEGKNNYFNFYFSLHKNSILEQMYSLIYHDKIKNLNWDMLQLPLESRLSIIEGYLKTDGIWDTSVYKEGNTYQTLSSTEKQNVDIIQALAHLSGYRTKLKIDTKIRGKNIKPLWVLSLNHRSDVYLDTRTCQKEFSIQNVWSVDTGGSLILIRHNGIVQITSNSDIGYHFVILKDGTVEIGRTLNLKGAHCRGNNKTIGICLVGKLQHKAPTPEQYRSLIRLLTKLCFQYNFSPYEKYTKGKHEGFKIDGHRTFCNTDCPGDKFFELLPRIRDDVKWQLLNNKKVSR